MHVIRARNVNEALVRGVRLLKEVGLRRHSRNGDVLVSPEPVTTVYEKPLERVLWWPQRDANPFFHFYESLWMLAGRNDVAPLAEMVKRMAEFSDDGETLHGAYGFRWRRHFGFDQLPSVVASLRDNPYDRRQVLQMWDATNDLGRDGKDLPCNTQVMFLRNEAGALDMTVLNRSNDMILGAYGANAVHFSFLQEYVANAIGCAVGRYWQVSNNFHAYVGKDWEKVENLSEMPDYDLIDKDPYQGSIANAGHLQLINKNRLLFDEDLEMFLSEPLAFGYREPFFRKVAMPVMSAYAHWKLSKNPEESMEILDQCIAEDWKLACKAWIARRYAVRQRKLEASETNDE